MKKIIFALVLLFSLSTVFIGCREEKKTPGEKIEEAVEDTGEAIEDAADDVGDELEDVVE
ncbi:membrane lipoprotein lipid attachment site-containing protein [Lacinutrix iliipiscaria]|uniref:Membrane lipoprotein lipid attachment site-containing protein n=1 Tax=Lacinutrix iliipiscaria TaxID=1230532 RepID=A0ABW5WNN8_9FLAO